MVAYNPPLSKSVVNIPESLKDRYEAVGWTRVETVKKSPTRRRKGDEDQK